MFHFSISNTTEELQKIQSEWQGIFSNPRNDQKPADQRCTAFSSPQMFMSWIETVYASQTDKSEPLILTGHKNQKLVLILPLVKEYSRGKSALRIMGNPILQYNDLIADDISDQEISTLVSQAIGELKTKCKCDLIIFSSVKDKRLLASLDKLGFETFQSQETAILDLQDFETPESYWKSKSKSALKQRNRLGRKLAKEKGEISTRFINGSDPEAKKWGNALYQMKSKQLAEQRKLSPSFSHPDYLAFLEKIVSQESGALITVFQTGNNVIALELGFIHAGIYYAFIGTYDNEYAAYCPGQLQWDKTVEYLFSQDVKIIDLLPPLMGYKEKLCDRTIPVKDKVLPLTFKGKIYSEVALKSLRPLAKRIQEKGLRNFMSLPGTDVKGK